MPDDSNENVYTRIAKNLESGAFVKSDCLVTSVVIDKQGGYEHMTIFVRGQCAGNIVANPGDGKRIAERLISPGMGEWRQGRF